MQTAMSIALSRVGLLTEEQAKNVVCLPRHLMPYKLQIEEISRLAGLLKTNDVKVSGVDTVVYIAYEMDLACGQYAEAFNLMLSHLKKRTTGLGLV